MSSFFDRLAEKFQSSVTEKVQSLVEKTESGDDPWTQKSILDKAKAKVVKSSKVDKHLLKTESKFVSGVLQGKDADRIGSMEKQTRHDPYKANDLGGWLAGDSPRYAPLRFWAPHLERAAKGDGILSRDALNKAGLPDKNHIWTFQNLLTSAYKGVQILERYPETGRIEQWRMTERGRKAILNRSK